MTIAPNSNAHFLVKWKSVGMSDEMIAAKLGVSIEWVTKTWAVILEASKLPVASDVQLIQQFNILCHQFQLVGESLKIIHGAISNVMTTEELKSLIAVDPETTVKNLQQHAIVLRPFVAVNPQEALDASLEKMERDN